MSEVHRRSRFPASLGRREPYNFQRRRTLLQENNIPDLYRPPYNAPRHAAGRLRARCGSNAQQSCVPATALAQKNQERITVQKLMPKTLKTNRKIDEKSIKNESKIDQNRGLGGVWADSGSQTRLGRRLDSQKSPTWVQLGPTWPQLG